jgi:hypothetical protein
VLVVGGAALFIVPAHVQPPMADSESYLFSFNNRVWEVLLLLLALTLLVVARVGKLSAPLERRLSDKKADGLTTKLVVICSVITAALAGVMIWIVLPVGAVNDGTYFLDRIRLMERGAVPYRDFEFIYGTGALYASLWISRLLHLSAVGGYDTVWFVETLLAVPLLRQALRWTDLPRGGKVAVFLLLYSFGVTLVLEVELNYTLFRYALPFFLLTALPVIDRTFSTRTRAAVLLWAAMGTALLLLLSPEEGLVYAIAVCLFLPARRWSLERPFLFDAVCLIVLCGSICAIAFLAGSFLTMTKFGAGAYNLPDWPGPSILITVFCLLLSLLYVGAGDVRKRLPTTTALLVLYGVGMIPGAFGRCDSTHLEGYEMPVLACGLLLCWPIQGLWRAAIAWSWVFLFAVSFLASQWFFPPVLSHILLTRLYDGGAPQGRLGMAMDAGVARLAEYTLGATRGRIKIAALRAASGAHSVDPHQVFPTISRVVYAPFDYRPLWVSNYQSPTLDKGYFLGTLNILTPPQINDKILELQRKPEEDLIVSWQDFSQCAIETGDRAELRALLLLPWVPAPSHTLSYRVPLCTYIFSSYHWVAEPSPTTFHYGFMRHNTLVQR